MGCDIVSLNEGGALVGLVVSGSISNVVNNYSVYGVGQYTGGIFGNIDNAATLEVNFENNATRVNLDKLKNNQAISAEGKFVGGVFGNGAGDILGNNLVNHGTIVGLDGYVGGVAGFSLGTFTNLENTANINNDSSGTMVGGIMGSLNGKLDRAKNSGAVTGSSHNVAGILGYAYSSEISYLWNTGRIEGVSTKSNVSGIMAQGAADVSYARNSGVVIGGSSVGGVSGINGSSLSYSLNEAPIKGFSSRVGGLVGIDGPLISITFSVNKGFVTGTVDVGGVLGVTDSNALFSSNSNFATVSGTNDVGGLVGYVVGGDLQRDFKESINSGGIEASNYIGGLIGYPNETGTNVMLSLDKVINLNSAFLDSTPSSFGSLFGTGISWGSPAVALDENIWAGTSPFASLPSPTPIRSGYGVKANSAPITDTGNSGSNDLNLCTDVDDSDSDSDICTPGMSAAAYYANSSIGLDSSSSWELAPVIFAEPVGLGDGITTSFTAMLQLDNILQQEGSVKLELWQGTTILTALDDGAGNIVEIDETNGDWLGNSTIDYVTGEVNLEFNTAPESGNVISVQYTSTDLLPSIIYSWDWDVNPNDFPWSGSIEVNP